MANDRTPLLGNILPGRRRPQPLHQRALQVARAEGEPSWKASGQHFFANSWIDFLLVFIPLSILAHQLDWRAVLRFSFSLLALAPLAKLLNSATDELATKTGPIVSGLLNAPFGTTAEITIGLVALFHGDAQLAQSFVFGTILCNLLAVTGCAFIAGGYNFFVCDFQKTTAYVPSSLVLLTCCALTTPALYYQLELPENPGTNPLLVSRGSAIILLSVYLVNLFFRLKTHRSVFKKPVDDESHNEEANANALSASLVFLVAPVAIVYCSIYLLASIDPFCRKHEIDKGFIALILMPLAVNISRQLESVRWALSGRMEVSVGIALGGATQIAAFVTPLLVIVGWVTGRNITLFFTGFEAAALLLSSSLVNALVIGGRSNYLQGVMFLALYMIFALAFWGQT